MSAGGDIEEPVVTDAQAAILHLLVHHFADFILVPLSSSLNKPLVGRNGKLIFAIIRV